jgi:hypothetical protein
VVVVKSEVQYVESHQSAEGENLENGYNEWGAVEDELDCEDNVH